jgi:HrpA-like RNA helicase
MQKLEKNRVIIISGDTGCGKTTQVPKFILESGLAQKQDVKIICT